MFLFEFIITIVNIITIIVTTKSHESAALGRDLFEGSVPCLRYMEYNFKLTKLSN